MLSARQKQGLEHIQYEVSRMADCFQRWQALRPGKNTQTEVNDLIELTLLHARAVLDFFEYSRIHTTIRKKKAFVDDMVSEDYGWPASEMPFDREIKTRIDKEVAHLSYFRCGRSSEQKRWKPEAFVPALLEQSVAFIEHVNGK